MVSHCAHTFEENRAPIDIVSHCTCTIESGATIDTVSHCTHTIEEDRAPTDT